MQDYGVAFCTSCKVAVPLSSLHNHLRAVHRGINAERQRQIVKHFEALPVVRSVDELELLKDGSASLSFLKPPQPGYFCPDCTSYKTIDWRELRRHTVACHDKTSKAADKIALSCYLQRWTHRKGCSSGSRYWKVDPSALPLSNTTSRREKGENKSATDLDEFEELMEMEAREDERLLRQGQENLALDEELEHDENTDWLRGCRWPQWFLHKPLQLIVASTKIPTHDLSRELYLGQWYGRDCSSTVKSERSLLLIIQASDLVLDRCEETLRQTPRQLRCWLRSWTFSYSPYPFEIPRPATVRKYRRIWFRFLCYIFRISSLAHQLKENVSSISGLTLTQAQRAAMNRVLELTRAHPFIEGESLVVDGISPELLEVLFQLFVTFWTEVPSNGDSEACALSNFSGVLGIHPGEYVFRRAYDYTPFLSALIWTGRLVILEYSLPLRAYSLLAMPWPARDTYADLGQRFCNQVRPKYLLRGSISPLGYLIERLQHGRATARRDGARTNITWSLDGQTLGIDDAEITMSQFRHVIHCAVSRVQQQMDDLLFGWWPSIRLEELHDDMSIHRPGYSFLSHPSNKLQSSFRTISRRAFSKEGGFSLRGQGRERAMRYLRARDRLVRFLLAGIHLTSGMPARGQELRMIRWADSLASQRNVFVFQGKIVLVFSYNKASTHHNNSFYVVRAPCPAIQNALFVYLAYIRPFCDFLTRQLEVVRSTSTNVHLFTLHNSASGCFSTEHCNKSLQEATPESPNT